MSSRTLRRMATIVSVRGECATLRLAASRALLSVTQAPAGCRPAGSRTPDVLYLPNLRKKLHPRLAGRLADTRCTHQRPGAAGCSNPPECAGLDQQPSAAQQCRGRAAARRWAIGAGPLGSQQPHL